MSNPIIELQSQLRNSNNNSQWQNNPNAQQARRLLQQIKFAQNPQQALNQALLNNPQIRNVIQLIKNNGGNSQVAFMNYAKQLGVNPQDVLNFLNS